MLSKEQARKFVSPATHKQLTKLLYELEHVTTRRDIQKRKEKLKDLIGKLFTYKEVFELHDDHILELAETVVGLYPEREELEDYAFYILQYLGRQQANYEKKRKQYQKELKQKEKEKNIDPDGYLDKKYEAWTYEEGYYRQRNHMYGLLKDSLNDLLLYKRQGVICRQRKST